MGMLNRLFGREPQIGISESGIGLVSRGQDYWGNSEVDGTEQNISLQQQYDNAYNNFPIVAAAIDVTAEQVVQDFYFDGPNSGKLSKFAEEVNLHQNFLVITKHMIRNGNLWAEFPSSKEMKFLDPKTMKTWRKLNGEGIGHSQEINGKKVALWGTTGSKDKDSLFEKKRNIKEIVHFKYNALAGDKYGNSLIHCVLPLLRVKDQIERDVKMIVRRYAAPIIHAQVGNDLHMASDTDITTVQTNLKDIYADTEYVTNHLVKFEVLGFKDKAMNVDSIMGRIDANIIAGLQVPPELIGLGTSSKSEAEVKLRSFGRHVKSIQMSIRTEFEDKVIIGLGLGNINDHIVWGYAEEREEEINIDMLRGLVKDGIITPQKANSLLPEEYHEVLPKMEVGVIGTPGNPQNQTPYQKGADAIKDKPTDPTLKQKESGQRRNKTDRFSTMESYGLEVEVI